MICHICNQKTSNVPEPCVCVDTAWSGPRRSGIYNVSTTEYRIDPMRPIAMICTCDECYLKAADCKMKDKSGMVHLLPLFSMLALILALISLFGMKDIAAGVIGLLFFAALSVGFFYMRKETAPFRKMSDRDKIDWYQKKFGILKKNDVITIPGLLEKYSPGAGKMAKSNPLEYANLTREFHSSMIHIPVNMVANLPPMAFMHTYSLPNRAFAERVAQIARQYRQEASQTKSGRGG